jgi:hypothetical protein
MTKDTMIGGDLAKNVFQLHALPRFDASFKLLNDEVGDRLGNIEMGFMLVHHMMLRLGKNGAQEDDAR